LRLHHLSLFRLQLQLVLYNSELHANISPFSALMFKMMNPSSMFVRKFNSSLNFYALHNNITQPRGSIFGSSRSTSTKDSSSSNLTHS
jgi:hypothetical protein